MLRTSNTGGIGQLREYVFTVALSGVFFQVQLFALFLSGVFVFCSLVVSFFSKKKKTGCFGFCNPFCVFFVSSGFDKNLKRGSKK